MKIVYIKVTFDLFSGATMVKPQHEAKIHLSNEINLGQVVERLKIIYILV
jgi:hypothetical protein